MFSERGNYCIVNSNTEFEEKADLLGWELVENEIGVFVHTL